MLRYVLPALLMSLALAAAYVVLVDRPRTSLRQRRVAEIVAQAKDLAWSQRDLDPELAGLVIAHIRGIDERGPAVPADLDDLLELAYQHRESSPYLSPTLIDLIRAEQRELGG